MYWIKHLLPYIKKVYTEYKKGSMTKDILHKKVYIQIKTTTHTLNCFKYRNAIQKRARQKKLLQINIYGM